MLDSCCGRLSKREPLELIYLDKTGFIPGQTTVACLLSSKAAVPTLDREGILAAFPVEGGAGGRNRYGYKSIFRAYKACYT